MDLLNAMCMGLYSRVPGSAIKYKIQTHQKIKIGVLFQLPSKWGSLGIEASGHEKSVQAEELVGTVSGAVLVPPNCAVFTVRGDSRQLWGHGRQGTRELTSRLIRHARHDFR
jgi:hypothetical protein